MARSSLSVRVRKTCAAVVLAAALSSSSPAHATTWIGASGGSWSDPSNWSGGMVPPEGGNATFSLFASVGDPITSLSVLFDGFYTTPFTLSISAQAGMPLQATVSINQNAPSSQMVTSSLSLCGLNRGNVNWNQSAGTMIVQNGLLVGVGSAGNFVSGSYNLSGNGSLSVGSIEIGPPGGATSPTGNYRQSGGMLNCSGTVIVHRAGNYTMSEGTANLQSSMTVGGNATFSGGRTTIVGALIADAGESQGTLGKILLSNGTLDIGGTLTINTGGSFMQTGGTLRANAYSAGGGFGGGTFSGTLLGASTVNIGSGNRFTQIGQPLENLQRFTLSGTSFVGGLTSAQTVEFLAGTFSLSNSTLTAASYKQAAGTFNGTLLGVSTFDLSGGGFTQNGQALTPTSFKQSGGSFSGSVVGSTTFQFSNGTFNQVGVPVQIPGPFRLTGGFFSGAVGSASSVELLGGNCNIVSAMLTTASYRQDVGTVNTALSGVATFELNGGTFNQVGVPLQSSGPFRITGGYFSGSLGSASSVELLGGNCNIVSDMLTTVSYRQDVGTVNTALSGVATVELNGGTFTQTSGSITPTSFRQTGGFFSGAIFGTSSFEIAGGNFNQTGGTISPSTLTQSGGTFSGMVASAGTFELTGGSFTQNAGSFGVAAFHQAGNSNFNGHINNADSFLLNGGSHIMNSVTVMNVGSFTQTGGTFVGSLVMAPPGTFELTGGSFMQSVGSFAVASFHEAGNSSFNGHINNADSFLLEGGSHMMSTGAVMNVGSFTQTGGTFVGTVVPTNFSFQGGSFTQATATLALGQLHLTNGNFTAALVTPILSIAGGQFTQSGGTIALTSFAQTGGTFNGTVDVQSGGSFTYTGGTYNGAFRNRGIATLSSSFSPAGAVQNDGSLTLATSRSLIAGGTGIDNTGSISLNGGSLSGSSINNTGTIGGSGRIENTPVLTNGATGTIIARPGNLTIAPTVTLISDGTLANAVGANLFVQSTNITRIGNITANSAGAVAFDQPINIPSGHTATLLGGTIAAPTVTNNAGATIRGFGALSANMINAGSVDFFGQTTLLGDATIQTSGQMLVRNSQTLVIGNMTNNGVATISTGGDLSIDQTLNINSQGTVRFNAGSFSVATLNISGGQFIAGPGADKVARTAAISITSSGKMDVGESAAIVDYTSNSPFNSIRALIISAYNGGAWNGPGILSSFADATTHGIGFAERSELSSVPAIFGSVDTDTILIRFTRYGDADLDANVNLNDFNRLAGNFGVGVTWLQGDFNYDNLVNLNDFNLLAGNFGLSAGPDGPTPSDWAALAAAVPEPGSGMALVLGIGVLGSRRRRLLNG